jgi:hypothetical protein
METEFNPMTNDLGLRIDLASQAGSLDDLAQLETECLKLQGNQNSCNAILYFFRANIQSAIQNALAPTSWAWR